MKLRFGKVETKTLLSKIMRWYVTKNFKKEFSAAFEGQLQGMQEFEKQS